MAGFEKVAETNELNSGQRKSIIVDEISILLIRVGDVYYAIEDLCTHDGQPLTDGSLTDGKITCPRHGAQFDLETGKALCMPATEPVETFEVQQREDGVYVERRAI